MQILKLTSKSLFHTRACARTHTHIAIKRLRYRAPLLVEVHYIHLYTVLCVARGERTKRKTPQWTDRKVTHSLHTKQMDGKRHTQGQGRRDEGVLTESKMMGDYEKFLLHMRKMCETANRMELYQGVTQ